MNHIDKKHFSDFCKYANLYEKMTQEQETAYLTKYKTTGKECYKKALILHNLKFVIGVALKYKRIGVDRMELINEGIVGFSNGIDKFNIESGNRLLTYCVQWIRASIGDYLRDKGNAVRLPAHHYNKLRMAIRKNNLKNIEMNDEEKEYMEMTRMKYTSDEISEGDNKITLGDSLVKDYGEFEEIEKNDMKDKICDILDSLPENHKNVLISLFGIESGSPQTLHTVGQEFNISHERVRQIRAKAFESLREEFGEELHTILSHY